MTVFHESVPWRIFIVPGDDHGSPGSAHYACRARCGQRTHALDPTDTIKDKKDTTSRSTHAHRQRRVSSSKRASTLYLCVFVFVFVSVSVSVCVVRSLERSPAGRACLR